MLFTFTRLLCLVALAFSPRTVVSTLISSAQLQLCTASTASQASGVVQPPCTKKFVLSLAVEGGQGPTESVAVWRQATDTTTSTVGSPVTLHTPLRITVTKSVPMIRYPVTYVRHFNAKPFEQNYYTTLLESCSAGAGDPTPTCGRAFDNQNHPIRYSEGFCCTCDACQLLGLCGQGNQRSGSRCAVFGTTAAASCLRFGPLWYAGYSLGTAETWYDIAVTVAPADGGSSIATTELRIGPDQLGALDAQHGVTAQLLGDFAAFKQPLNMENRMLFIPSIPADDRTVTAAGLGEWMVLPLDDVSVAGDECNKVGVSYEAFALQGSRCDALNGACLANQLADLRASDVARATAHQPQQYSLLSFGAFEAYVAQASAPVGGTRVIVNGTVVYVENVADTTAFQLACSSTSTCGDSRPFLAYPVPSVQASVVVLSFAADNVSFTINVATGRIINASVASFEAVSKQGRLLVTIINTGNVVADFYISVQGCSEGVAPLQQQFSSLVPMQLADHTFDIVSIVAGGRVNNACNVTLFDSLFDVVDSLVVHFVVGAVSTTTGPQGGTVKGAGHGAQSTAGGSGGGGIGNPLSGVSLGGNSAPSSAGGCGSCPWYNPVCFISFSCIWQSVVQFLVIVAIIAAIVLLIRYRKTVCSCFYETDEEREEAREKRQIQREERAQRRQIRGMNMQLENAVQRAAIVTQPPSSLPMSPRFIQPDMVRATQSPPFYGGRAPTPCSPRAMGRRQSNPY